jgi:cobalt-zinc-cadmium resistance protein CzcA
LPSKIRKLETASTLPDFNVGYFNQSLIGVQSINGADVNFDGSKRFQGFNVGVSVFLLTFFSNASK